MRTIGPLALMIALGAAPALAQSPRAYVAGEGGVATSPDATSGDVFGEAGVQIARGLSVFGGVGQFRNLQPSAAQPTVDNATSLLGASLGLDVNGTARVPAWYSIGGLRYAWPASARLSPYVMGGAGFARLNPTARFTFTGGTLPDGSTPAVGADVTSQVIATGEFIAPPSSTAFMYTLGGGVQIPVTRRWAIDAGYRFSRVSADTPVNVQGATFGLGYRF